MARFERSRERKGDSRERSSRRGSRDNRDFEEYSRDRPPSRDRRSSGRGSSHYGRDRRDIEMTKVTCSECGKECEVPFKPTTDKPLFCKDCFKTKGRKGSGNSSKDLEIINEKLDKIMKSLKIE